MTKGLRGVVLDQVYRSSTHKIGRDFYARLLTEASHYRRAAGFFSSSVFGVASAEHLEYMRRGGRIELICSDMVSPTDAEAFARAVDDPELHTQLDRNWQEAQEKGALGVPTFVIGDQIFWGQDRLDFVGEHLRDLGAARQ